MNWFDSELQPLPIIWTQIEAICEIDPGREVLSHTFEAITVGLEGNGYFDDLYFYRNRIKDYVMGSEVVKHIIPQSSGEFEIPVFANVKEDAEIVAVHIVPKEDIVGNDTDYCQLILNNATKDNKYLGSITFWAGNDAPAYEVTSMLGLYEEMLDYGDVLTLTKMDFGAGLDLPQFLLVIEWNLA